MATLTIKNLPDDLYEQLKQSASQHRRSINGEVIVRLEGSLLMPKVDVAKTLGRIRKLRKKTSAHPLTDREIAKAKAGGRP